MAKRKVENTDNGYVARDGKGNVTDLEVRIPGPEGTRPVVIKLDVRHGGATIKVSGTGTDHDVYRVEADHKQGLVAVNNGAEL